MDFCHELFSRKLENEPRAAACQLMAVVIKRWSRIKQWMLRLAEFGLVQGLVQVLTALTGLLIIRALAKPDYALFAITNTMQGTINMLADLGISIGVRSIGGRVCDDPQRFGQLLNAALTLRRWFATASLGVIIPIAAWMLRHNGASWQLTLGLCAAIVVSVIPQLASSVWSVSLQLHAQYRRIQKIDIANALIRLVSVGTLRLCCLNSFTAALTSLVGNWCQMFWLKKYAICHADISAPPNEGDKVELKKLSAKMLPNGIFYCLQSQITIWLITFFGNANHVAEVGALGRISVLFTIFYSTMNSIVLPRFSRCQEPRLLLRRYFQILAGCVGVSVCLIVIAAVFSKQFLWLLGPSYAHLRPELLVMVLVTVTGFIAGAMWAINSSRAWVRGAQLYVPATIATQIIVLLLLNVSTVRGALWFGFWSLLPSIILNAFMTWDGFRKLRMAAP